jgi:O-antigen/teichoic acid export membrane protein
MKLPHIARSNISILAIGSIISQALAVCVSPLLTRIYSPEEIGLYTIIINILSIIVPICSFRFEAFIVLADTDEIEGLVFVSLCSIIITVFLFIFSTITYSLISNKALFGVKGVNFLVVPLVIANGIMNILFALNNRSKDYSLISKVSVLRSAAQSFGQVCFGFLNPKHVTLVLVSLFSNALGASSQIKKLRIKRSTIKEIIAKSIIVYKKYNNRAFISMPVIICSFFFYSWITFLISAKYSLLVVGLYSITYRVLAMPIQIVSTNVSKVLYERAVCEIQTKGNFKELFIHYFKKLFLLSIPVFACLFAFAPSVFSLAFGPAYYTAGIYVRILCPMFLVRFISSSFGFSLLLRDKQKTELLIQLALIVVVLITTLLVPSINILCFLSIISVLYSIFYAIILYVSFISSKKAVQ